MYQDRQREPGIPVLRYFVPIKTLSALSAELLKHYVLSGGFHWNRNQFNQ